ncbi:hypothetical protein DERF_012425 [Dermatophagoides farinae]|uniref:Uncharacterized protein n=1 Tax=Dermatophagoides farinae TaxID=6954 RepID=A0A922KXC6_DERFA|nr:hypothetical protein DERF_012425 [Dermatophagoides farinae]
MIILGWVYILDYNQLETLISRTFHLKYSNITTLIINIPKQSCFGFPTLHPLAQEDASANSGVQ